MRADVRGPGRWAASVPLEPRLGPPTSIPREFRLHPGIYYSVDLELDKTRARHVVHVCDLSAWKTEAGRSQVGGQPGLCRESLISKRQNSWAPGLHACNPSTWEAEVGGSPVS